MYSYMRYALSASLFVVCIGASGGSAAVQDAGAGPGAKAIMERVEAAKGTLPANERITETYEESGLKGKRILYRLNKDWREVDTFGPFATQRGELHGQHWFRNRNGETVLAADDPGKAVKDRFTKTVTRVSAPVDAYVISELNAHGSGERTFVDPTTWRIVRTEDISEYAKRSPRTTTSVRPAAIRVHGTSLPTTVSRRIGASSASSKRRQARSRLPTSQSRKVGPSSNFPPASNAWRCPSASLEISGSSA